MVGCQRDNCSGRPAQRDGGRCSARTRVPQHNRAVLPHILFPSHTDLAPVSNRRTLEPDTSTELPAAAAIAVTAEPCALRTPLMHVLDDTSCAPSQSEVP
jgi:hypothetical protein